MKRLLFSVLMLCSIFGFSQSQKSYYGVRAALNVSNLDFASAEPEETEINSRTGFSFGFYSEFKITEKIAVAPEVQFSAEGSKRQDLRIDYIQLPVVFKYKITEKFAFALGPQASLKTHNFETGFNDLGFSAIAGLEYMFFREFFVDARYSYGFSNVFRSETLLDASNKNIQIGIGFKF